MREGDTLFGVGCLNLAVLFLSDIGIPPSWSNALLEDISEDLLDWEIEVLHTCRKSSDFILKLPEGTKTWEARVALETVWRTIADQTPSFVSRSARQVAMAILMAKTMLNSDKTIKKTTSAGIVFIETHKVENLLYSEDKRLWTSLQESGCADLILKRQLGLGNILFVKEGKETDDPSFKRIARIVQECYRSVIDAPLHIAGRGLMSTLNEIQGVLEVQAPRMISDESLVRQVKKEIEI